MVSVKGYSKAALLRASNDDVDLDLEIVSLGDFRQWQAAGAIPYAGRNAILLPAPLGWVVDGKRRNRDTRVAVSKRFEFRPGCP